MPFVLCEPCGRQVIIDPSGTCPEGHRTGVVSPRAGLGTGRVAASIGHRSSEPDPDEPEPWIGRIEVDELSLVGAGAPVEQPEPRAIHPLAGPAMQDAPARSSAPYVDDVDRDALLRELQALGGDVGGGAGADPTRGAGATTAREQRASPPAHEASPAQRTSPAATGAAGAGAPTLRAVPDLEERRAAAAELASLESALADLGAPAPARDEPSPAQRAAPAASPPPPPPPRSSPPTGGSDLDGLAELAEIAKAPGASPRPDARREDARPPAAGDRGADAAPAVPPAPPAGNGAPSDPVPSDPVPSEPAPPIMGGFTAHGRKKRLFGR